MECAREAKKDGLRMSALSNDHPPIPSLKSDSKSPPTPSPVRLDCIAHSTLNLPPTPSPVRLTTRRRLHRSTTITINS
ncbi:unnamed protein product [Heligmosomoides polygyrus]|uniref:Uncharacterized protein n=1 Tax=Heligmosomoides polygyrus TaxID=6339 RepID=A0A183FWH0_HELPZ|nr:unnamed protein product [Heligmosomoides polygyrus]